MKICMHNGTKVKLTSLDCHETYLGVMLGDINTANKYLLADIKRSFVPSFLQQHHCVGLCVEAYKHRIEEKLPNYVCVGLFADQYCHDDGSESSLVAVWFQNELFQLPPASVMEAFRKLDWEAISKRSTY